MKNPILQVIVILLVAMTAGVVHAAQENSAATHANKSDLAAEFRYDEAETADEFIERLNQIITSNVLGNPGIYNDKDLSAIFNRKNPVIFDDAGSNTRGFYFPLTNHVARPPPLPGESYFHAHGLTKLSGSMPGKPSRSSWNFTVFFKVGYLSQAQAFRIAICKDFVTPHWTAFIHATRITDDTTGGWCETEMVRNNVKYKFYISTHQIGSVKQITISTLD